MNILTKIIEDKLVEVHQELSGINEENLTKTSKDLRVPLDFRRHLQGPDLSIIAEVKKASPSKGLIRSDFDPVLIAQAYENHKARCISVLTEKKYFRGHPDFLRDIRQKVSVPILRKDFIVDERQIRESYDMEADAILLIVSALSKEQLQNYYELATTFGLTCLVEVHTPEELDIALDLKFDLIGINNRNLTTFQTDIAHSIALRRRIPDSVVTVSESGISTPDDCLRLKDSGFDAILVGETLMRQPDPGQAISELMSKVR